MIINAGVNVKNWLIKVYVIRDIFGILVFVNVNAVNHKQYLDYENCKFTAKLADKLVEECTYYNEEVKIILFTTNTWIVIKKMFLNMIMSIK